MVQGNPSKIFRLISECDHIQNNFSLKENSFHIEILPVFYFRVLHRKGKK